MLKSVKFKETKERSIVKSGIFRVLVIVSDLVIIYLLTHKLIDTIAITVLTNLASTIFYFLHERIWNNVSWGKRRTR